MRPGPITLAGSWRMLRKTGSLFLGSALGLVLPVFLAAQPAPGDDGAAVDTLLAAARIPGVLQGLGTAVGEQVRRTYPDLPGDVALRIQEAVDRHFDPATLYAEVAGSVAAELDPRRRDELLGWLTTGDVAEWRSLVDAYVPPTTLDAYVARLAEAPPPETRVRLMLRLARAQAAGPFYLLVAESVRGAAHAALRSVGADLPPFRGVPGEEVPFLLEAYYQQAVVALLHRYDPVPDELLRSVAEHWETEAGQWYADVLGRAVGDAVLDAAERVAGELSGSLSGA